MSLKLFPAVRACSVRGTQKFLLLVLASYADDDGSNAYPSVKSLAQDMGVSVTSVHRAMRALMKQGLVRIDKRGGRGPRDTNRYSLEVVRMLELSMSPRSASMSPRHAGVCQGDAAKYVTLAEGAAALSVSPSLQERGNGGAAKYATLPEARQNGPNPKYVTSVEVCQPDTLKYVSPTPLSMSNCKKVCQPDTLKYVNLTPESKDLDRSDDDEKGYHSDTLRSEVVFEGGPAPTPRPTPGRSHFDATSEDLSSENPPSLSSSRLSEDIPARHENCPEASHVPKPDKHDLGKLSQALFVAANGAIANPAACPGLLAMTVPSGWLAAGADLDLDVLPAVRAVAARAQGKGVRSWSYFTRAVQEAQERRQAPKPQAKRTQTPTGPSQAWEEWATAVDAAWKRKWEEHDARVAEEARRQAEETERWLDGIFGPSKTAEALT